jgi:hypothetical protein
MTSLENRKNTGFWGPPRQSHRVFIKLLKTNSLTPLNGASKAKKSFRISKHQSHRQSQEVSCNQQLNSYPKPPKAPQNHRQKSDRRPDV